MFVREVLSELLHLGNRGEVADVDKHVRISSELRDFAPCLLRPFPISAYHVHGAVQSRQLEGSRLSDPTVCTGDHVDPTLLRPNGSSLLGAPSLSIVGKT